MEIAIDPSVGQQSVGRTLELFAAGYGSSTGLPVNPEGHEPGGAYSESAVEIPGGTLRFLYYAAPGGDPELLGQVPPSRS